MQCLIMYSVFGCNKYICFWERFLFVICLIRSQGVPYSHGGNIQKMTLSMHSNIKIISTIFEHAVVSDVGDHCCSRQPFPCCFVEILNNNVPAASKSASVKQSAGNRDTPPRRPQVTLVALHHPHTYSLLTQFGFSLNRMLQCMKCTATEVCAIHI